LGVVLVWATLSPRAAHAQRRLAFTIEGGASALTGPREQISNNDAWPLAPGAHLALGLRPRQALDLGLSFDVVGEPIEPEGPVWGRVISMLPLAYVGGRMKLGASPLRLGVRYGIGSAIDRQRASVRVPTLLAPHAAPGPRVIKVSLTRVSLAQTLTATLDLEASRRAFVRLEAGWLLLFSPRGYHREVGPSVWTANASGYRLPSSMPPSTIPGDAVRHHVILRITAGGRFGGPTSG
jgi:hypothetical protein